MRRSLPSSYSHIRFSMNQLSRKHHHKKLKRKLICSVLIFCLLALPSSALPINQLLVMASATVATAKSPLRDLSSFLASLFAPSQSQQRQDTLADRYARVSRIQITPNKFVGYEGQPFIFSAIGTDNAGRTIQG